VFRTEYPASRSNQKPTVFHVTHWKAGSQWVRSVLNAAAPDRLVQGKDSPSWFFKDPIVSGGIYTPVYTTAEAFHQIVPAHTEDKTFVLIRDPRDTAVSWYFSLLYSHPTNYETVSTTRETLQHLNKPEGMTLVFRVQKSSATRTCWPIRRVYSARFSNIVGSTFRQSGCTASLADSVFVVEPGGDFGRNV
jgi:hypothetical protein